MAVYEDKDLGLWVFLDCTSRSIENEAVVLQVNVENVMKTFQTNAANATAVILRAIPQIVKEDWAATIEENKVKGR